MTTWTPGHTKVPANMRQKGFHKKLVASGSFGPLIGAVYLPSEEDVAEAVGFHHSGFTPEQGDSVFLSIRWVNKSGLLVDLGAMSSEELDALDEIYQVAMRQARSVAQTRDAIAREAEQRGDYSLARSNRSDPKVTVKPGYE